MRYFCHHCRTQITADELLADFTCPSCHSGFVEEMPSSRRSSSLDESQRPGSDDGNRYGGRLSSDEFSDDNSDVEFLDAYNGSLAHVFDLFQPLQHNQQLTNNDTSNESSTPAQSSQQFEGSTSQTQDQQNRRRQAVRVTRNPGSLRPTVFSATNQSLADVLNDFISGVSFGTQYPEGAATSAPNVLASGSAPGPAANRGLINIDFPIPFFLHSNPGDYAWGNAGFDAVITQLLNNLDGSNSGPPPMPKDQVESLPVVKIKDDQVKKTNLQCTVCMDDFQVGDSARQLPCEHFFHQDCIIPWLDIHASCPICRKTFISGSANSSQSNANTSRHDDTNNSSTDTTRESNPNDSTTTSSTGTASSTAALTSNPTATQSTNTRNPASTTASSAAVVTNQSTAPSYDYTEDDCD